MDSSLFQRDSNPSPSLGVQVIPFINQEWHEDKPQAVQAARQGEVGKATGDLAME